MARGGGRLVSVSPRGRVYFSCVAPSTTARSLARAPRVLTGWPLPLGFGLGECLLLARREYGPPPRAPANDRPGFPFGFLCAGGRLPTIRNGVGGFIWLVH